MKKKSDIINNILLIPTKLNEVNSQKSLNTLLEESGYYTLDKEICKMDIENGLAEKDIIVESWIVFSENKRTNEGWYFYKKSSNEYIVGYHPHFNGLKEKIYINKYAACADYIKQELMKKTT